MNDIKVSVIVAAYNIEDYIVRCLESISFQTLKELEVIVVNDGSIDSTPAKVQQFITIDSRIILINQDNKGSIEARKTGLNQARGKYILFVDGDDWLELESLEMLYDNAEKNNSDIVLCSAFRVDKEQKLEIDTFSMDLSDDSLMDFLIYKIRPELWFKFIKREYIWNNDIEFPQNISFAEDLATGCSLFMYTPRISTVNYPLYNYYIRQTSVTNTINERVMEINDAFSFIKEKLTSKGIYEKYRDAFEASIYLHIFSTWTLTYAQHERVYSKLLYRRYKKYNINIYSNPYIKEKLLSYPMALKLRIIAYHHSYRLGILYDKIRGLIKRNLL